MVLLGFSEVLASLVAGTTVVVSPGTKRWTPWVRTVIPNGVDTTVSDHERAPRPCAHGPLRRHLGWAKRGVELARAFSKDVRPAVPDAELWMVTQDAPDDPGEGVRVLGRLDDRALEEAYSRAWVFCLPSAYEGFGIPYAEALASGLPVVATPNVGARYVLAGGAAGVLTSLDGLGTSLTALLVDPEARARLGAAALERSRTFSLGTVVDRYERLYRGA